MIQRFKHDLGDAEIERQNGTGDEGYKDDDAVGFFDDLLARRPADLFELDNDALEKLDYAFCSLADRQLVLFLLGRWTFFVWAI